MVCALLYCALFYIHRSAPEGPTAAAPRSCLSRGGGKRLCRRGGGEVLTYFFAISIFVFCI